MKQIAFAWMLALLSCIGAQGQNRIVTERDNSGNTTRVIELHDTVINGKTTTDTLGITTYEDAHAPAKGSRKARNDDGDDFFIGIGRTACDMEAVIAIVAISFVFGLPALLIFIIFYFRYKNRKAKYRLAEQAIASGQPLPEDFFKTYKVENNNSRTKGFKNLFLGIGLFIFLLASTEELGLACIGLLISCIGIGQLAVYYTQPKHSGSERQQPAGTQTRDEPSTATAGTNEEEEGK